jgi:20S proteasome alpha/beta subunit
MAVTNGIVMAADRQAMHSGNKVLTRSVHKLFAIGSNVGVSCVGMTDPQTELYLQLLSEGKTFDNPKEAAAAIKNFLINEINIEISKDADMDNVIFVAGYDKKKGRIPVPEVYYISIQNNDITTVGSWGFTHIGSSNYFEPYQDRINSNRVGYSLQDAVDICKLAFDLSRGLEKYLDFEDNISPDIEMLAITPSGIKWILKKELEVKI